MTFRRWLGAWCASFAVLFGGGAFARAAETNATVAETTPFYVASTEGQGRLTFAVIIGNNRSLGRRRPELHYADDDAVRYFEILQTMAKDRVSLLTAFDRDTERLFPNISARAIEPSRAHLLALGRRLTEQVRAARTAGYETEVYFVFAGHGDVSQGEGFVELSDAPFTATDLKSWLSQIPFTRAHVILDSCNSFFMLGVRKPGGRHFATSEDAVRALSTRLPNVGVFLSTSAEGEAFEWSEIQSGIFSHVVRSGLLGAADADGDGAVSYLELAAFVDTATLGVRNPNMRPHVFARGPGAADSTPIARVRSMTDVRRFQLTDNRSMRIRLRDSSGVPLLDAHTEPTLALDVALPVEWAKNAIVERSQGDESALQVPPRRRLFVVPDSSEMVTLAKLEDVHSTTTVRGPDETFQTLFSQPFGPKAVANYVAIRRSAPPPVYGVSREDIQRMDLVLSEIARAERNRRVGESLGGLGFGFFLTGAGLTVLQVEPEDSAKRKRHDRIIGGSLVGLGALMSIGSTVSLAKQTQVESAAEAFRSAVHAGGDPAQAFAEAEKRLKELEEAMRAERLAGRVFGVIALAGSTTGFVLNESANIEAESRRSRRLAWGAGMLFGSMILSHSFFGSDSPSEALTKIWREDPSINQYRTTLSVGTDGTGIHLMGSF